MSSSVLLAGGKEFLESCEESVFSLVLYHCACLLVLYRSCKYQKEIFIISKQKLPRTPFKPYPPRWIPAWF